LQTEACATIASPSAQRSDEEQAPLVHGKVAVDVPGDGLAVMRPTFYIAASYGHESLR